MNWHLIPYVQVNGAWSLADEQMLMIYEEAQKAELIDKVFFAGEVRTPDDWLALMKRSTNVVHTIWGDDEQPYLIAWLNDWGRYHAFAHFITFPRAWGSHTVGLLKKCFKYWFDFKNDTGGYVLDTIVGRTPSHRREVTRFLFKVGAHVLGEIPSMAYDMYQNKRIGLVISYITREDL